MKIADVAYILLVAAIVVYPQLQPALAQRSCWRRRLYLVMFVWENLLLVADRRRDAADPARRAARRAHERPAPGPLRHARRWRSCDGDGVLLELRGVDKSFGGLRVIAELDLDVEEGEIVSVIGPNGAGKTTLFNLITGIYRPDSGEILFEGGASSASQPHRITEARRSRARSRRCGCS